MYRRVKARVIAGVVSVRVVGVGQARRTAYLHLVPQLRLALLARLGRLLLASGFGAGLARHGAPRLQRDLAGMHIALRIGLHAAPCAVFRRVSHTRGRTTRNLAGPHAPRQPLGLLPLQLLQHLLDGYRVEDLLRGRRQNRQHRERAVFLVLLEAPAQVLLRDPLLAHALPRFAELAQRILAGQVGRAEDAGAHGQVGAVAPQPVARRLYHRVLCGAMPGASR